MGDQLTNLHAINRHDTSFDENPIEAIPQVVGIALRRLTLRVTNSSNKKLRAQIYLYVPVLCTIIQLLTYVFIYIIYIIHIHIVSKL